MIDGPVIQCASGDYVSPLFPHEWTPRIDDIAHALSHLCRFTGHTREMYSVCEHSCRVADILPPELRLAGLLHDAGGDAHNLDWIGDGSYDLVILDPPYSDHESDWLYGTPPLKPGKFTTEAVRVTRVGGHIAVYHVRQPKRPPGTRLVHRIVVLTRTNHAPRVCFIFEKLPPASETQLFEAA